MSSWSANKFFESSEKGLTRLVIKFRQFLLFSPNICYNEYMQRIILCFFIMIMLTGCTAAPLFDIGNKLMELDKADFQQTAQELKPGKSEQVNIPVLFASQAPMANWDLPYQEACEESALILAAKYFAKENLTPEIMDQEIQKLVEWEKQQFGLYSDTTLSEVKIMADEYFGLQSEITQNITIENIKNQLDQGYLILMPMAGRELGNPYYTQPGPIYHFLLIRGYTEKQFITNDVGTRRGEGFKYDYSVIINANHDLSVKTSGEIYRPYDEQDEDEIKQAKMLEGGKNMLIIKGQ